MKKAFYLLLIVPFFLCCDDIEDHAIISSENTEAKRTTTSQRIIESFGDAYGKYLYGKYLEEPNYADYALKEAEQIIEEFGEPKSYTTFESTNDSDIIIEKAFYRFIEITSKK